MITRCLAAVLLLSGIGFIGVSQVLGASSSTTPASATEPFANYVVPTGPELPLEKVEQIAAAEADQAGEPSPSEVSEGTGSLEDAMRSIDSSTSVPEPGSGYRRMLETPVYLVAMHGHFTLKNAHVPQGDPAPTGSVLDLVIDAYTGAVVGRALPIPSQQGAGLAMASIASRKRIATGIIAGRLFVAGGPARPSHPGPVLAGRATVFVTRGSRTVAQITTTSHGAFRVRVKPGSYLVVGAVGRDCQPKRATVGAGRTTRIRLGCSIR